MIAVAERTFPVRSGLPSRREVSARAILGNARGAEQCRPQFTDLLSLADSGLNNFNYPRFSFEVVP